ncbi:MAG: TVP38/TMEM64 family protein [Alphaproteobacteria bacterium]|nr:TVP38/TMEM64 family protein [Alphaproteobacteria bacterium]
MIDAPSANPATSSSRLARMAPLLAIAAAAAAFFALGLHRYLSFDVLRDSRAALNAWVAAHPWLAPVLYVLVYVVATACSLPGALVLTLTGGFLFGTWYGGLLTVMGATIGATLLFLAARTALGDSLRAKTGGALAKLEAGFRRDAFNYLLVLRLVPIFPFFIVNLAAAFLGATLTTFVVATFFGIMPGTLVYASVGAGLGSVFDAGAEPDLKLVFSWPVLGPLLGLAGLALLPVIYKRLRPAP